MNNLMSDQLVGLINELGLNLSREVITQLSNLSDEEGEKMIEACVKVRNYRLKIGNFTQNVNGNSLPKQTDSEVSEYEDLADNEKELREIDDEIRKLSVYTDETLLKIDLLKKILESDL